MPFSACDTVVGETPAAAATSRIPAGRGRRLPAAGFATPSMYRRAETRLTHCPR